MQYIFLFVVAATTVLSFVQSYCEHVSIKFSIRPKSDSRMVLSRYNGRKQTTTNSLVILSKRSTAPSFLSRTSLNMKRKQTPIERLRSTGTDIQKIPSGGTSTVTLGNQSIMTLNNRIVSKVNVDMVDHSEQKPYKLELKIDDDIASSSEVLQLIDSIGKGDSNPLISMQAKIRMRQIESLQVFRNSAEDVASIPEKVTRTYEKTKQITEQTINTIQGTPDKIQNEIIGVIAEVEKTKKNVDATVKEIQAIPRNLQRSVDTSIEQMDRTVKDVKAIPGNVRRSIKDTRQKIDGVKETIDNTVSGAIQLGKSISSTTQSIFRAGSNLIQKTNKNERSDKRRDMDANLDDEINASLKLAQEAIRKASKP